MYQRVYHKSTIIFLSTISIKFYSTIISYGFPMDFLWISVLVADPDAFLDGAMFRHFLGGVAWPGFGLAVATCKPWERCHGERLGKIQKVYQNMSNSFQSEITRYPSFDFYSIIFLQVNNKLKTGIRWKCRA